MSPDATPPATRPPPSMTTTPHTPFPATPPGQDDLTPPDPIRFLEDETEEMGLRLAVDEPDVADLSLLATGGTGEIYSGRDEVLGRSIAIKTLRRTYQYNPDQMWRLVREAKAAAQLEHPNIVPIHALGLSPSKGIYFTMKRLRGDSLRHIVTQLAEQNPGYVREYTIAVRLGIFSKICQGVSYAHSKGIIHRDLKPENVLVGNYGEVTIIDWGLVKKITPGVRAPQHIRCAAAQPPRNAPDAPPPSIEIPTGNVTLNGELNGTPRFMSPEQIFGVTGEVDECTDIYALGIILYELLTYTNPFSHLHGEDEITNAVARGQYLKPHETLFGADIAPELEAICLKAMHVNKENRYQAVAEIIKDINAHLEGRPVGAYHAPIGARAAKCCRRNPIKTAILLSSVCSILVFMLSSYLITSLSVNDTINNALHDFRLAAQKLRSLEHTMPRQGQDSSPEQEERILGALNEIDNFVVSGNFYLSSLPSQHTNTPRLRQYRERIFVERIRFALNHGSLNDLRKVRGAISAQFGIPPAISSRELVRAIQQLDVALEGLCTLSIASSTNDALFSIAPILEDPESKARTPGEPLALSQNTLPADGLVIPKGDYLITFSAPGRPDVICGLALAHGEHVQLNVNIPSQNPPGTVFIPEAKNTLLQRDDGFQTAPHAPAHLPFFIAKNEVTLDEYRDFWLSLDDPQERARFLPRIRLDKDTLDVITPWDDYGDYNPVTYNGHPMFSPDMPVTGISHAAASAFCSWKGRQLRRLCRLPTPHEWLRAATGDDGRAFPWGNAFDPSAAFLKDNPQARDHYAIFAPIASFPNDLSPYGLHDMAGNAREWTSTTFDEDSAFQIMGASASLTRRFLPLTKRSSLDAYPSDIGFRYIIEYQDNLDSIPILRPDDIPTETIP